VIQGGYFAPESIYCNMEKIIYINAVKAAEKQEKDTGLRSRIRHTGRLPYPVTVKEGMALGFPITEYRIEGISEQSIGLLSLNDRDVGKIRLDRTLKKIKKQIEKKEMQTGDAFLFCGWREHSYPPELISAFYRDRYRKNMFVFRAEQLILLDGWEKGEEDERFRMDTEDTELTFVSEIYSTFNYATIVTEREDFWQGFVETAYEEYGLSVRCAGDGRNLIFRNKKTLVADLSGKAKECCRNLPADSVYMDFRESAEKSRSISAKRGEIPYLSVRNALDTALKDTV